MTCCFFRTDIAVVELFPNSAGQRAGDIAGYFGFCATNCASFFSATGQQMIQLGYPAGYEAARRMTRSNKQVVRTATDYRGGSGMNGGSSGGPWIVNFGYPAPADTTGNLGLYSARNIIFAVTSWGFTNAAVKVQGAVPLGTAVFKSIYNAICSTSSGALASACVLKVI
mmetsp:Transcript_38889/g.62992  ORF Transcript_38889/g.62992 Transcript_38889/m.62992 type:complete len:169 (+) Transcript_38889:3-509(+)